MRKLPTVTRQLAERRARLAAEVPRLEKLAADISEQLAKARAELAAVDLILPTFDARVVPELIAPVKAQGVRYGIAVLGRAKTSALRVSARRM